ncbi:MAG: polysaccharide deacetylase family protein [Bacillota bacterium]
MMQPNLKRLLAVALAVTLVALVLAAVLPSPGLAADRVLKQGDRGDDVKQLQVQLTQAGYPTGGTTGFFGSGTLKALKSFQQNHHLQADGLAGPATLAALTTALKSKAAAAAPSVAPQTYTVKAGDALSLIAERYRVSLRALMEANGIKSADRVYVGQKLTIPGTSATGTAAPTPPASPPAPAPPPPDQSATVKPVVYPASQRLALTFDDGPDPAATPDILDVLARHKAVATFFVVGDRAEANPDLVKRLVDEGHTVENHGYQHVDLTRAGAAAAAANIQRGAEVIKSLTGRSPQFFRPPQGAFNDTVTQAVSRAGQRMVMWSNIGQTSLPADQLKQRLLDGAFDGAVLILHDTDPAVAQVLDEVLTTLEQKGFRFVTVSQLFADA